MIVLTIFEENMKFKKFCILTSIIVALGFSQFAFAISKSDAEKLIVNVIKPDTAFRNIDVNCTIIDATEKEDKIYVEGYCLLKDPKRADGYSLPLKALIKSVLGENSVIELQLKDPEDGQWFYVVQKIV